MQHIWQDVRHAIRALRKVPGMSFVSIVTLAVGIAAVSTIFSFVNSVFYRPLPYPDADRIVALTTTSPKGYYDWSANPLGVVEQIRHEARSFQRVAAYHEEGKILSLPEASKAVGVTAVDSSVFALLQARPQRGRLFSATEIRTRAPLAIISDSLWRSTYGSSESIVNQPLRLDGTTYTIVGVLPRGYRFYMRSDVIIPLAERPDSAAALAVLGEYGLLAKLRPGVSLAQARREFEQLGGRLSTADPQFRKSRFIVQDGMYDRSRGFGPAIYSWLFVGVATCVLLIACTNVANLLLVRAAERRPEMAIRTTLGASRARLIRLALAESLIIGLTAGAMGALLSVWGSRLLFILIPTQGFPSWIQLGVDARVLAFTLLLALVAVAAIGVTPALEGTRLDLVKALKVGGDTIVASDAVGRSGRRGVTLEIALSVMLFFGAALLWRSYQRISATDLGYTADQLIQPWVSLDRSRYADDSSRLRFAHALAERASADARVEQVAVRGNTGRLDADEIARKRALGGRRDTGGSFYEMAGLYLSEDRTTAADHDLRPQAMRWAVSDSYFRTMGLSFVQGRGFDEQDQAGSAPVAVVSEALARLVWHRQDVVGRTFTAGQTGTPITIIGVARDYRSSYRDAAGLRIIAMPAVYYSERQSTPANVRVILRARGDVNALAKAIPNLVHDVDAQAIVDRTWTMAQEGGGEAALLSRVFGTILGVLAVFALLLAAIGTYGVIAFGVTLRTREIGLRIALGGSQAQVTRLFVRQGMRTIGAGLAIGVAIALAASQVLRGILLGVSPFDPLSYGVTIAFFGAVALLACWLPARRAARVEPMVALRGD